MILPKKVLKDIQGYEPPLYIDDYLMKLDLNENILGPSPKVIKALQNISEKDIKFYPAYGELLEKLANFNNIDKAMILPANGADEAIKYVVDTFIEQEDKVLGVNPTFAMPKIYAQAAGCNYKEINYKEKWVFPTDELIENIDEKTKLIIITTPNSPTGEAISRESLLKILNSAPNSLILIDETYSGYAKEKFTDLIYKYPNVIITRSLSKDFALAGLRLGYIISDKQNIDYIKRIINPYSVNTLAVKAGIAALDDIEYFEFIKKQINESKEILSEGLKKLAKIIYPSETNFLLADFGENADFIYKRLLNSGIKVKYFKNNPDLKNCFRITVPEPEQAKFFLSVLAPRDLIIFDMDGVLVDVRNSYRTTIKAVYEHFSGRDISSDDIQTAKNNGGLNNDWDLTGFLLRKSDFQVSKNDIINKFQELYYGNSGTGYILNETLLVQPEFLKNLAKKYDLAIYTGRPRQEAEFILKKWNLRDLFSLVITMDDVPEGFHKPDPYGINYILSKISSVNTYYLGDTPDDMIAAKKAKIKGIGILPPQDKSETLKQRLLSEGALVVLEKVEDLNINL
ncbi:MAG: histidinol-phosphate transaminase [bacterium]